MIARRSIRWWLTVAGLPVALTLGGCAASAGSTGVPAADEQPADEQPADPVVEETPRTPSPSYPDTTPSTCFERVPGDFC
jgi:hypothetical protein